MRRWDTDFNAVVDCASAGVTVRVEASSGRFTDVIRVVTGQQSEGGDGRTDGSGKIGWGSEVGGRKFVVGEPQSWVDLLINLDLFLESRVAVGAT